MAKKKTDPDERPPPPVIGRTFQAHVNNTVLPGVYSKFCELAGEDARADGKKRELRDDGPTLPGMEGVGRGAGGASLDDADANLEAYVERRLKALPRGRISIRTARRWLKVCAGAADDCLTDCSIGPGLCLGVKGATGHVCRRA